MDIIKFNSLGIADHYCRSWFWSNYIHFSRPQRTWISTDSTFLNELEVNNEAVKFSFDGFSRSTTSFHSNHINLIFITRISNDSFVLFLELKIFHFSLVVFSSWTFHHPCSAALVLCLFHLLLCYGICQNDFLSRGKFKREKELLKCKLVA